MAWFFLLSLAPITVFSVTPWSLVKDNPSAIANLVKRLIGLWAYTLLFIQIVIGAFMTKWIEKFGAWVFNFHVFEGKLIYALIILHPLAFTFFYYFLGKGFDPFYSFVDVCILCKKSLEYYYNFGRISFWFLTIGVSAALFRATTPFLRAHWHKFHILNYAAFILIFVHSLMLGSDVGTAPFSFIHFPAALIVLGIIIWKIKVLLRR